MSVVSSFSSVGFSDLVSLKRVEEVYNEQTKEVMLFDEEQDLEDPVSYQLMKNPVILHCGCILDRASFEGLKTANQVYCPYRHPLFTAPLFITSVKINRWFESSSLKILGCGCIEEETAIQKNLETKDKLCFLDHDPTLKDYVSSPALSKWLEKKTAHILLNCNHFQELDEEKKDFCLKRANNYLSIDPPDFLQAIDAFYEAFFYTKSSQDYQGVVRLYQKMGLQDRVENSLLYLLKLQLEEKRYEDALKTLEQLPLKLQDELKEIVENIKVQTKKVSRSEWTRICQKRVEKLLPREILERKRLFEEISHLSLEHSKYLFSFYYYLKASWNQIPYGVIDVSEWGNQELLLQRVPISLKLSQFLESPCPIWGKEGKLAKETHFVFPIPAKIWAEGDWKEPTIEALESFSEENENKRLITDYSTFANPSSYFFDRSIHWAVLTKKIIPNTVSKSGDAQKLYLLELENANYQIPPASIVLLAYLWQMKQGEKALSFEYSRALDLEENPNWLMRFTEEKIWEIDINPYKDGRFGTLGFHCFE